MNLEKMGMMADLSNHLLVEPKKTVVMPEDSHVHKLVMFWSLKIELGQHVLELVFFEICLMHFLLQPLKAKS
jgi:hypothetical protein